MDAVPSSRLKLDRLKYEKEHNYNNSLLLSDNLSLIPGLSAMGEPVVSSGNVSDYNGPVVIANTRNSNLKSDVDEEDNDDEEYDLESNPSDEGVSGNGADSSLSNDSYSTSSIAKRSGKSNAGLLSSSLTMGSSNRNSYNSNVTVASNSLVSTGSAQLTLADRRAHHNSLERKRREHIKSSFNGLRDAIPSMVGEKVSRSQILRKAGEYIQSIKKKTSALNEEVDELRRQNAMLDQQIKQLERSQQNLQSQDPGMTQSSLPQPRFQSVTIQPLHQHQQQTQPSSNLVYTNGHVFRVGNTPVTGIMEGYSPSEQSIIVNAGESHSSAKKPKVVSLVHRA